MIHLTPPAFRAFSVALVLVAGASCWSTAAFAQAAPATTPPVATGDTVRLTEAQRAAVLDANTEESAAAARGELGGPESLDRRVHGEVGIMIGSHGTHAVYGTAEIPLGENGQAIVSFESGRFGYRR